MSPQFSGREVILRPGTTVFRQGDECSSFTIVLSGSVRVFGRSSRGKEVLLYRVTPGEACVLTTSCLLGGNVYPADAVAESEVRAQVLTRQRFEALLDESPDFRRFVFRHFSQRLRDLVVRIESLLLEPIEMRLLSYLTDQVGGDGYVRATQQQMAEEVGTAREVVSRHLTILQQQGLINVSRGRVQLLDLDTLRERISGIT